VSGRSIKIRILRPTRATWAFPVAMVPPAVLVALIEAARDTAFLYEAYWLLVVLCVAAPLFPLAVLAAFWPRAGRAMRTGAVWTSAAASALTGAAFRPDRVIRQVIYERNESALASRGAGAEIALSLAAAGGAPSTAAR
jgi:hypothetical protein